jgi:two-component system LytT family sensor kinase
MNPMNKNVKKFVLNELRDIAILIFISTIPTYLFAGNQIFINFPSYSKSIFYGFIIGWTIWKGNQVLGFYLDKKLSWEKNPSSAFIYRISASIVYTIVDIIIVNYLIYTYIYKINVFDDLRRLTIYAVVTFGIAMLVTTIIFLNHFFISWKESLIQKEKFKQDSLSMQYETLKSYVNPHFLFNSLSVLSSLVERDTAKSQEFIKQLSDIYRYVLEQKDKELVPLETELTFMVSYINLHRIRHGENLRVDFRVEDKSGQVIPLSMQILLENAFKHNIISEEEPLEVSIWRENDYVIVQNKLQTRKTINENGGIGLETISKRYEFFNSKPLVVSNENGYFTVKLPVLDISNLG